MKGYKKPADAYQKMYEAVEAGKYVSDSAGVVTRFSNDLQANYELTSDSIHGVVFNRAWRDGHSAGLQEVLLHFDDLVEIVEACSE